MDERAEYQSERSAHVVLEGDTFVCHNCGQRYRMNLPCPVSLFAAAAGEYANMHERCERQPDRL